MADFDDQLRLREIELKHMEFQNKLVGDAHRTAVEYSKIIITNLIWINTAGLGSLPVIAAFVGISDIPWSQKFPLLVPAGFAFAFGLFAAIMCALAAYYNYSSIANSAASIPVLDVETLHLTHPLALQSKKPVRWTYYIAHIMGWVSLSCFLFACYKLATISRP